MSPIRPPGPPDPLTHLRRLSGRDRLLLSWLAEHYVLSTEQVTAALFPSRRAAQKRLTTLTRIGAVSRFAFAATEPGAGSYRYTLGPLGALLHPTGFTDPDNPAARAPRSHLERRARILRSPRLAHLLGVNQFFVDLLAHTRTHPDTALERWWSEQHATTAYAATGQTLIRPDGHGVWRVGAARVGFFLEHDTGSEDLPRLIRKLPGYEHLAAAGGPRYPVLLWLPDRRREARVLATLAGVPTRVPVATAVHSDDPAGPVWALSTDPAHRRHLHHLPSDHGPAAATNPHRPAADNSHR
jgi:hypothetical protein